MKALSFDFHGLAGLLVESDDPEVLSFFGREYAYHQGAPEQGAPLVRLRWSSAAERRAARPFRWHRHKLLARWRYRIELGEDGVLIEAAGNRLSVPMVHHMLVHPSLRFLVGRKGTVLLHGAALARKGRSLVLTGRGGAGKTTASSLLLAYGSPAWELHADDYVFVGPGPESHAYLTRAHLYRDLLRWVPAVAGRLSRRERLALEVFGRLRAWSHEGLKWPVRVGAERLWPGRAYQAQALLAGVLLLRRAQVPHPMLEPIGEADDPVGELLEMNFFEARHFIRLVGRAPTPAPSGWLDAWRAREREALVQLQSRVPFLQLVLPEKVASGPEQGQALAELLEGFAERGSRVVAA